MAEQSGKTCKRDAASPPSFVMHEISHALCEFIILPSGLRITATVVLSLLLLHSKLTSDDRQGIGFGTAEFAKSMFPSLCSTSN